MKHRTGAYWTAGIMAAVTALSYGFDHIGFSESTVVLVFLLGVLLVAGKTDGYRYGITASVVGVLSFNYFFTAPRFSFTVNDPQYLVTFTVMLTVAMMTSALTARVKQQAELSVLREHQSAHLFRLGQDMLETTGIQEIQRLLAERIRVLIGDKASVHFPTETGALSTIGADGQAEGTPAPEAAAMAFRTGKPADAPQGLGRYLPIVGQTSILGVMGFVPTPGDVPDQRQQDLAEAVSALAALAVDRERYFEAKERSKTEIEKERLRSTLLRSISHDLRTPLTGIAGAAGTLLENYHTLDEPTAKRLLEGISEDVQWLIRLVENLLSMTRLEAGKQGIRIRPEAVEEVVAEAVELFRKRVPDRKIRTLLPEELILLPMDGNLVEQVLINLLDNAVKYGDEAGIIQVRVSVAEDAVSFEVADQGQGIAGDDLPKLFEPFYTGTQSHGEGRRGSGLGLAICQAVIRAHHGEITAANRPEGGAVFTFSIPFVSEEVMADE